MSNTNNVMTDYENGKEQTMPKTFFAVRVGKQWRINRAQLYTYAGITADPEQLKDKPTMVTISEAANILGVCPRTILRMCKEAAA